MSVTLNSGSGGALLLTDQVAGVDAQVVKLGFSASGVAPTQVSAAAPLPVDGSGVTQPVSGTFWQATQPVSNAGTFAVQAAQSGTWNITNVSGTVSLPTGASTAAKQPALGIAGTASADVITVQGIASMTALKVDGSAVTQPVSGTFWQATQPVSGTVSITANSAVNVAQINGVTPLMGNGVTGTGSLRVTVASDNTAFSVNAVQSGTYTVQPGNTANTTPWLVTDTPAVAGGLSISSFVGAASNNKTAVKASAGQLYFISVQNLAATPVYLKVFDATSANVTAGTTACTYQFMIPGNTAGAGVVLNVDKGIAHANAITIMLTAGIATTDNTSVVANNQVVTLGYK